ncbi:hypothetical protein SFRURICE_004113 [Spodoptera frugiperda]|nr:hypothetical protein SFRURICE_004113 [Spodoptera frugiperda]
MDREEAERLRILAILQESDSDTELSDQDVCDEEDHLSERSISIDTEQDISESDNDDIPLLSLFTDPRTASKGSSLHDQNQTCAYATIRTRPVRMHTPSNHHSCERLIRADANLELQGA